MIAYSKNHCIGYQLYHGLTKLHTLNVATEYESYYSSHLLQYHCHFVILPYPLNEVPAGFGQLQYLVFVSLNKCPADGINEVAAIDFSTVAVVNNLQHGLDV